MMIMEIVGIKVFDAFLDFKIKMLVNFEDSF